MKQLLYTLLAVSIIFSACEKEEEEPTNNTNNNNSGNTTNLAIGDTHQGGIIFYLDANGGGLISALPISYFNEVEWGCYGTLISEEDGIAIGTGAQNTINIEAECNTPGTAADICDNLTLGGYSDWFLPSKDELNEMYLNIGEGNALGLGNIGDFDNSYWSSTERDNNSAWFQDSSDGRQDYSSKGVTFYVRPIRAF
tara:strand:+ start:42 stop:632 length:591 start_codon:yes stop_codon:yes gene_type:complete